MFEQARRKEGNLVVCGRHEFFTISLRLENERMSRKTSVDLEKVHENELKKKKIGNGKEGKEKATKSVMQVYRLNVPNSCKIKHGQKLVQSDCVIWSGVKGRGVRLINKMLANHLKVCEEQ